MWVEVGVMNPQGIIKDKHADQPTKTRATHYHTYMLPLLKFWGWKQLTFKNACICKEFHALLDSLM